MNDIVGFLICAITIAIAANGLLTIGFPHGGLYYTIDDLIYQHNWVFDKLLKFFSVRQIQQNITIPIETFHTHVRNVVELKSFTTIENKQITTKMKYDILYTLTDNCSKYNKKQIYGLLISMIPVLLMNLFMWHVNVFLAILIYCGFYFLMYNIFSNIRKPRTTCI